MKIPHVQPGWPFRPPAGAINAIASVVNLASSRTGRGSKPARLPSPAEILIRNDTASVVGRHNVLALDRPISEPVAGVASADFKFKFAFEGVIPVESRHAGTFAVLRQPLQPGEIGKAIVLGMTPALVNVADETHRFADIEPGTTILESSASGAAEIVWKAAGTGQQWAMVRVGRAVSNRFAAIIGDAALVSAGRWRYAWREARYSATADAYAALPTGRTSADAYGVELDAKAAVNRVEDGTAGHNLTPIAAGSVVMMAIERGVDGSDLYAFSQLGCGCEGDCLSGCPKLYVYAGLCPGATDPYVFPDGRICPSPLHGPGAIFISVNWPGYVRHPPGTVPTTEQLEELQTVIRAGSCYQTRKHLFCLDDYPTIGDGYDGGIFTKGPPGPGCPAYITELATGVAWTNGGDLTVPVDGCANAVCQPKPGAVAFISCNGIDSIWVCADMAGSSKVILAGASPETAVCYCRVSADPGTPPEGESLFSGFVYGGSPSCCSCKDGCAWFDDGTTNGCCCGIMSMAGVEVTGTALIRERYPIPDPIPPGGATTYTEFAYELTGAATVGEDGCIPVTVDFSFRGEGYLADGTPVTTTDSSTSTIRVCAFCEAPCPISACRGLIGVSPRSWADPTGCATGVFSFSGTSSEGPVLSTTRYMTRECGLVSITETNTEVGVITSSGQTVDNDSSIIVSITMNFHDGGCTGACVGTAPSDAGGDIWDLFT